MCIAGRLKKAIHTLQNFQVTKQILRQLKSKGIGNGQQEAGLRWLIMGCNNKDLATLFKR